MNEYPQLTLNKDTFLKNLNNTFDQRDVTFNKSIIFIQKNY